MYYDIGAYDMLYSKFREMSSKCWTEKFNYLCIDMIKKNEGKYSIFNESENIYIECIPETEVFSFLNVTSN